MNPYDVLGVEVDASDDDIKKAWRKKCSEHHPDKHGGDSAPQANVNLARDILLDPVRRERYDLSGELDSGHKIDDVVRERLFSIALKILGTSTPKDLVRAMRAVVMNEITACAVCKGQTKEERARAVTAFGTVKPKGAGDNILDLLLQDLLSKADNHCKSLEKESELLARMLAFIDEKYELTPIDPLANSIADNNYIYTMFAGQIRRTK